MSTVSRPATIGIVDSDAATYDGLLCGLDGSEVNVCFLSNGNDALRFARRWGVGLWLINTRLPDMNGFDLAQMLRRGRPGVRVFMVGDAYSVDEELQTMTLGLVKYLCKPVDASWILQWGQPSLAAARNTTLSAFMAVPPQPAAASAAGISGLLDDELDSFSTDADESPMILPFKTQPQRRPAA